MKSTMRFAALAASVLLALAGVACSSDDDDNNSNQGAGGTGGTGGQGGGDTDAGDDDTDAGYDDTDAGDEPNVCDESEGDTDCIACAKTSCCNEIEACEDNEACHEAAQEFRTCLETKSLGDCSIDFITNAGDDGSDAANALATCMDTGCSDQCAGPSED